MDVALNTVLPAPLVVGFWAAISGVLSMVLYKFLSPQKKLDDLKSSLKSVQKELSRYDGEFSGAIVLIKQNLSLALKQIALVVGPTLIAIVPVVYILFWCSHIYDYTMPRTGDQVFMTASPLHLPPVIWPEQGAVKVIEDGNGHVLYSLPPVIPLPVRHKKYWWNVFLPNPLGYIPETSAVHEIHLDFQSRDILPFGPDWMRSWLGLFITVLVCVSLFIKIVFRIH